MSYSRSSQTLFFASTTAEATAIGVVQMLRLVEVPLPVRRMVKESLKYFPMKGDNAWPIAAGRPLASMLRLPSRKTA